MAESGSDWHQPPSISGGSPVTLQLMNTGAGIGVGCGVGVGFISPLNLSAVPVLGQAASGISAGLGGVSSWLGVAGSSAQQAVRRLGVPGLDVGVGCGVLAGYYFGAGLMVKPSVVETVTRATTQLAGRLSQAVAHKLQQQPQPVGADGRSAAPASSWPTDQQQHLHRSHMRTAGTALASKPAGPAGPQDEGMVLQAPSEQVVQVAAAGPAVHMEPGQQGLTGVSHTPPEMAGPRQDAVVNQLLLQQQLEIAVLKKQNKQLRAAVCKIDPKAPFCKGGKGVRGNKGNAAERRHGSLSESWSEE